ncbi:MAG: gamma-glutamyl-gamma-aminobutyrate hydrolase family protein [Chloroflexi bacterium]|nr:gamma-glutamyl-gamma-aminobutyrate hydrolase family protein [Chloroflexota bacterium]
MTPPLIGITTTRAHIEYNRYRDGIAAEYPNAVMRAGGIPLLIPLSIIEHGDESQLRSMYERLDGILIPGGGDVHPDCYGEPLTEFEYEIIPMRDQLEVTLAKWAFEDDRPLLGICRGQQVMNVALGGTLMHDIKHELNGKSLPHRQPNEQVRTYLAHQVEVKSDSRLAMALGCNRVAVNSIHHQAVGKLAAPLKATAFANDGVVEGIEIPDAHFYMGVQWHPECLVDTVPEMETLFRQFVQSCTR